MLGRIFLNRDVTKRGRIGIVGVTDPIRQFDVQIARFLARWKIPGAVNQKSERGWLICQNRCGAVALMHIAIQDRHAPYTAFCWHRQRSYRAIVEHSIAVAVITEGMMRTVGGINTDTALV